MRPRFVSWCRFLPVALLLGVAALALQARNRSEILPPRLSLKTFPLQVGSRHGLDVEVSDETAELLEGAEFMVREYQAPMKPPINLTIVYFPSQRMGDTIHTPRNCLPSAGWISAESGYMPLPRSDGSPVQINRHIITKGDSRALVLYWYQSHGRVTANEYWAKYYMIDDAIRLNRTDGALVRFVTPISARDSDRIVQDKTLEFVHEILPMLHNYIPL